MTERLTSLGGAIGAGGALGASGSALGWLSFDHSEGVLSGLASWIKPSVASKYYAGGFTNETTVTGSTWVAPTGPALAAAARSTLVDCVGANLSGEARALFGSPAGGPFLYGDFSAADAMFAPVVFPVSGGSGAIRSQAAAASTGLPRWRSRWASAACSSTGSTRRSRSAAPR